MATIKISKLALSLAINVAEIRARQDERNRLWKYGPNHWMTWFESYYDLEGRGAAPSPADFVSPCGGYRISLEVAFRKAKAFPRPEGTETPSEMQPLLEKKGWVYSPWRQDPMWADLALAEMSVEGLSFRCHS